MSSWKELFVREADNGGLIDHFSIVKQGEFSRNDSTSLRCTKIVLEFVANVLNVGMLSHVSFPMVYTLHFPPLKDFGLIFQWILFWVCQGQEEEEIASLLLLTDFQR